MLSMTEAKVFNLRCYAVFVNIITAIELSVAAFKSITFLERAELASFSYRFEIRLLC